MATIAETACRVHIQQTGTDPSGGLSSVFPGGLKFIGVECADTVDNADILTINHANHGIDKVWYVRAFTHSTTDDIIITQAPTTVSSPTVSGQINLTVGGSTANKKRFFLIGGV